MRILIVDDDPLAGEMTAAMLEDAGHDCQLLEHGLAALEALAAPTTFDLLVSDLHMPLLSGLELLRELRQQDIDIPFVLLTGDDPSSLAGLDAGQEAGLLAVLVKDASLETRLPQLLAQL